MVKVGAIMLKAVVLGILGNAKERKLLEEYLHCIGCQWLLEKPWNLQVDDMVVELMEEKDNRWNRTIR